MSSILSVDRNFDAEIEPLPEYLDAAQVYSVSDLLLWKYALRGTKSAFSPLIADFPNPAILGDLLVVSTCSPGCFYGIDRTTGKRLWSRRLSSYGKTPLCVEDRLFASTVQSLLALEPRTGKILWEFVPYEHQGESLYSHPVHANGFVYIGDRRGGFHCLSAETGQVQWSAQTSEVPAQQVNATAIAWEDRIITATSGKLVLAYDQKTGREVWRQCLENGSVWQIRMYEGNILVQTGEKLYSLSPESGEIVREWTWPEYEITSVAVAGEILCVVISNDSHELKPAPTPNFRTELLGIRGDKVEWRLPYPRYSVVGLRWDAGSRLLYEASYYGLGIVDPLTGQRMASIHGFHMKLPIDSVSLPDIEGERLSILSFEGTVFTLRHPDLPERE